MGDRLAEPFRRAVERVNPVTYAGAWRYSVVSCDFDSQTIDALPLAATEMPPVTACPMRVPGLKLDIAPGSIVLIGFAENSPTMPYVAQYPQDPAEILRVHILGETARNAREGDTVRVTIPSGSLTLAVSGASATGPSAPLDITGTITSGSDKVSS